MKRVILFILIISLSNKTYAQQNFGLRAGINVASTKDVIAYPENKIGWFAGAYFEQFLTKKFFLHLEAIYSSKGHKTNNNMGGRFMVHRFNYLSLPILFGYKIDRKTNFFVGPEVSYRLNVSYILGDTKFDESKYYPAKIDAGISVGLNYKVYKNVGIDIRYTYGFNTIYYVKDDGSRFNDIKGANRIFQIGSFFDF